MDSNAGVLLVKPLNFRGVPTFSASWDIQAAMWLTYPVTKGRQFDVYNPWRGPVRWNGKRLLYSDGTELPFRDVYIWRPMEHEFFKATGSMEVRPDLTLHSLLGEH
jgi:hypothetical protein